MWKQNASNPSEQLHLTLSNFRKYLSFDLLHMYVFTSEEIHNTENTTFTHSQIYSFALPPLLSWGTPLSLWKWQHRFSVGETTGSCYRVMHLKNYVVAIFFKLSEDGLFNWQKCLLHGICISSYKLQAYRVYCFCFTMLSVIFRLQGSVILVVVIEVDSQ